MQLFFFVIVTLNLTIATSLLINLRSIYSIIYYSKQFLTQWSVHSVPDLSQSSSESIFPSPSDLRKAQRNTLKLCRTETKYSISSDVRTHLVDTSFRTQSFLWHLYSVQAIGAINFTLYWNMDSLTNQRENVTVKKSKELSVLPPLARLKMRVILFQKNQFPMPMF